MGEKLCIYTVDNCMRREGLSIQVGLGKIYLRRESIYRTRGEEEEDDEEGERRG